jgi:hypothetical protein
VSYLEGGRSLNDFDPIFVFFRKMMFFVTIYNNEVTCSKNKK